MLNLHFSVGDTKYNVYCGASLLHLPNQVQTLTGIMANLLVFVILSYQPLFLDKFNYLGKFIAWEKERKTRHRHDGFMR